MRFSQRVGKRPIKTVLEREGLSEELKNSIWNFILEFIIVSKKGVASRTQYSERTGFFRGLWLHFFKYPIDTLPMTYTTIYQDDIQVSYTEALKEVRDWYYAAQWYDALDFLEYCVVREDSKAMQQAFNGILKKEMSAYRFVDGSIVEIDSEEEIKEIEEAINKSNKFNSVKTHLKRALELYSERNNPDYRNSIKESISAVESLSKIILKDDKTTFGKALIEIEKKHQIPKSLKAGFSALYGYTSDEGGIRHSLLEKNVPVALEEARFMLIACSAFINYLIGKIG